MEPLPSVHPIGNPGKGTAPCSRSSDKRPAPSGCGKHRNPPPFEPAYTVRAFLDDHRWLTAAVASLPASLPSRVGDLDGHMLVVCPEIVDRVSLVRQRRWFASAHGWRNGDVYLVRFCQVLRFIGARLDEILHCGLARQRGFLMVREELVAFLLRYSLNANEPEIPHGALRAFLDDWGHRWI